MRQSFACLKAIFDLEIRLSENNVLDVLLVESFALIECVCELPGVIMNDVLTSSARDGVVMRHDGHDVFRIVSLIESFLDLIIRCLLLQHLECKQSRLRMEQTRVVFDLLLERRSRTEEAGPVDQVVAEVREHVVVPHYRPPDVVVLECLNVSRWRGVHEGHIVGIVLVAVLNDLIDGLVACVLVRAHEVVSEDDHGMPFASLRIDYLSGVVLKLGAPLIKVESEVPWIVDDIVFQIAVIAEAWWRLVVVYQYLGQDLLGCAIVIGHRLPKEDVPLLLPRLLFLIPAHSRKEEGLETKIREKGCIRL